MAKHAGITQITVLHPAVAVERPRGKYVVGVHRLTQTPPGYHQEDTYVHEETYRLLLPLTVRGDGGQVRTQDLAAAAELIYSDPRTERSQQ